MNSTAVIAVAANLVTVLSVLVSAHTSRKDREARSTDLENQRTADDDRFEKQREADERRWREQREADERTRRDQFEQEWGLRDKESQLERAKEHNARLNAAALEFLTVLGEALAAADATLREIQNAVRQHRWDMLVVVHKHWTNDLETRFAVATAKVRLFHNDASVEASSLHQQVLFLVNERLDEYRNEETSGMLNVHTLFASDLDRFSESVVRSQQAGYDGAPASADQ